MKNVRSLLLAIISTLLVMFLSGCPTVPRPMDPQNAVALRSYVPCQEWLTVFEVEDDEHLQIGNMLLLVGPIYGSGNFEITPVNFANPWDHSWKSGHYRAEPDPNIEDVYNLSSVGVAPHNDEEERDHVYQMTIKDVDENNCPIYVEFESPEHVDDGVIILDPGHAGARR